MGSIRELTLAAGLVLVVGLLCTAAEEEQAMREGTDTRRAADRIAVLRFLPQRSVTRVNRPVTVTAVLANTAEADTSATVRLIAPAGLAIVAGERACAHEMVPQRSSMVARARTVPGAQTEL